MAKLNDGMVQVEGQKVVGGGSGAKEHNEFESLYNQTGDAGAASLPKVEMPVANTPIGQQVK